MGSNAACPFPKAGLSVLLTGKKGAQRTQVGIRYPQSYPPPVPFPSKAVFQEVAEAAVSNTLPNTGHQDRILQKTCLFLPFPICDRLLNYMH